MILKNPIPILVFFFICLSCVSAKKLERIENKPLVVARHWLENYYYKNDYDEAKVYSTQRTADMIDTIKTMIFPEMGKPQIDFQIKKINCQENKQRAECTCLYMDGGEEFEEILVLAKQDGLWLVDMELLNDDDLNDEDIDAMTKEFEESLENLLQK